MVEEEADEREKEATVRHRVTRVASKQLADDGEDPVNQRAAQGTENVQ